MSTSKEPSPSPNSSADATTYYCIVGDAYVDLFCFLEGGMPEHGGDSRLTRPVETFAGGSSTNTATHLKALLDAFVDVDDEEPSSIPKVHLSTVFNPDDHYGQLLLNHATKHGYALTNCRKEEDAHDPSSPTASTGHCIAIVSGGERSFMTHQGVVGSFNASDLDRDHFIHTPANLHLHIAGYFNIPGFWDGALNAILQDIRSQRAKLYPDKTTTISLVAQHDATQAWDGGIDEVIQSLDFIILNDLECKHIVRRGLRQRGQAPPDTTAEGYDDMDGWAEFFAEISPTCNVIVTRGERGAVALRGGQVIANQTAVIVKVVDPTGAGDSFTAGFLHGLWDWKSKHPSNLMSKEESTAEWSVDAIREGLRWGCAVGAAAVLIRGASVPPSSEDVKSYYLSFLFGDIL